MRDAPAPPGLVVAPDPDTVAVGEVAGAHALRGWVRVRPYQLAALTLAAGRRVLLEHAGGWHEVVVTHAAPHGRGAMLVGFDAVLDRTAAERLRGTVVRVRRADLPPLADDEYWHHEVVGFAVETLDGAAVGTIAGTMTNGLHDVWQVRDGSREHLIPVVADVVRGIDRAGRRVRIEPIPGLLD